MDADGVMVRVGVHMSMGVCMDASFVITAALSVQFLAANPTVLLLLQGTKDKVNANVHVSSRAHTKDYFMRFRKSMNKYVNKWLSKNIMFVFSANSLFQDSTWQLEEKDSVKHEQ